MENNSATLVYLCVYLLFHWSNIVNKVLPKAGYLEKDKKGWGDSHVAGEGGCL